MNEWIKLLNDQPDETGLYRVLRYNDFGFPWVREFLYWTGTSFQPKKYDPSKGDLLDMDVTHWLKIEIPPVPIQEASQLLIETAVIFHEEGLKEFAERNNMEVYSDKGINATEYIVSELPEPIKMAMNKKFTVNSTHTRVQKLKNEQK
jgi:hypothetical protein